MTWLCPPPTPLVSPTYSDLMLLFLYECPPPCVSMFPFSLSQGVKRTMSPAVRLKLQLFLALFFGAVGFLSTLLCCGTDYWLLAAESCSPPVPGGGGPSRGTESQRNTETSAAAAVTQAGLCS